MRPSFTVVIILFIAFPLTGCVSKSNYQRKVDEAALLARTVAGLEGDFEQLIEEQKGLAARNDDLNRDLTDTLARNSALQQDLQRARADADRLEKVLSARSEEAGKAMAEMRRAIDRLQDERRQLDDKNRELERRAEEERVAKEERIARMKSTYDELVERMDAEIERGEITISELQGRLTVNMVERILFDSGKAGIKAAGLEILARVGEILKDVADKEIRVEGHTDDIPISPRLQQTFPSNWELSTARAENVVHYLQQTVEIGGERLSACGFGEYRPVAGNDTLEGRAQNRRIQIVLVPEERQTVEPLK